MKPLKESFIKAKDLDKINPIHIIYIYVPNPDSTFVHHMTEDSTYKNIHVKTKDNIDTYLVYKHSKTNALINRVLKFAKIYPDDDYWFIPKNNNTDLIELKKIISQIEFYSDDWLKKYFEEITFDDINI